MLTRTKLVIAALGAAVLMASAVGTATANRISVSNRNIRAVWRELTFFNEDGSVTIACPVTLEGTFHSSTIVKVRHTLVGYITRAIAGPLASCRDNVGGVRARVLTETLPWHIWYESFGGTLPNNFTLNLTLLGTTFELFILLLLTRCVYRADVPGIVRRTATNTRLEPDETFPVPLREGGGACPANGFFRGIADVYLLGTTTLIVTTLI